MYGKNPNHANKFRRFFNKNILPAVVSLYILQYQPVASGLLPAVASGALPGFSVRAAGRTKNGPEMFRNGPEALQKRFGACLGTDRERFGIFGTHSGRGVRDVRRLSCQGRSRRLEALLSGAFETFGASPDGSFGMFGGSPDGAFGCGPSGRFVR